MTPQSIVSINWRLLWIGAVALASAAIAAIAAVAFATLRAFFTGQPIDNFSWLPVEPIDLWGALIVAAIFAIELARNGWRDSALRRVLTHDDPSTRTDLVYGIISTTGLMTVATIGMSLGISRALETLGDSGMGVVRLLADLPLYAAVPGVLISQSFGMYWCHRLVHTRHFWPLHAVHHAATDFNIVTVYRHHPIDGVFSSLAMPLVPALLGFSSEAILIGYFIVVTYTIYIHSSLPTSVFLERWIAFGPHGHGIHHGADPSCFNANFGDLVIWDRLFGTYKTDVAGPLVYGCADPQGIFQSGRPLRDMIAVETAWVRGLLDAVRGVMRWRAVSVIPAARLMLLAAALLAAGVPAVFAAELRSIETGGTEFTVTMGDGRVLHSPDLVGAVLTVAVAGQAMKLRIDAVERDPEATRGDVWLHTLSAQAADGSWLNLCEPGPDGRRQGFPLAGRVRHPDGLLEAAQSDVFELTCTSGAQGKCVRFGYLPWESETMRARYNACVRMLRADYCGNGTPHTRDGTLIVVYDKLGIQKDEPVDGAEFEAAWGPEGAICVRHVRLSEIHSLEALRAACPRLKPEDIGAGCTEERMRQSPAALLINRSRLQ